jgi:4-diphosphocytidyl-2-C-methyl-D-erythritol kinase
VKQPLQRVTVEAAAKVNLGWRVGPVREDGFHDVDGVIQTITLHDRVEIVRADHMSVVVPGFPELERDNLVLRAAECLRGVMRHEPTGVRITIEKRIPVAAGLGGGSADAAATLVGLNALWGAGLSARRLVDLGASIGSDVPPLLLGGLVRVTGRGEVVSRIGESPDHHYVLGVTSEPISAADAYRVFDRIGGEPPASRGEFHNDLEAAACELLPALGANVGTMREAAGVAFVSGSGPTVVGITDDPEAVANEVRDVFDDVIVAAPSAWGVRLHLSS